jgi:hypothetical protein
MFDMFSFQDYRPTTGSPAWGWDEITFETSTNLRDADIPFDRENPPKSVCSRLLGGLPSHHFALGNPYSYYLLPYAFQQPFSATKLVT